MSGAWLFTLSTSMERRPQKEGVASVGGDGVALECNWNNNHWATKFYLTVTVSKERKTMPIDRKAVFFNVFSLWE